MKLAGRIRQSSGWICVQPQLRLFLEKAGLETLERLSSRDLGQPITDRRRSWVRLLSADSTSYYIKTYDYPAMRDRGRGALRNTFLARSRARREWEALCWLRDHGFAAPEPLGVWEKRRWGWLHRAVLITQAWPGQPLHRLLPVMGIADRDALLEELRRFLSEVHAAGFRDGNMDLRNLLARRTDRGVWQVCKIDSPRSRVISPGPQTDRAARRDRLQLTSSLRAIGFPALG